MKPDDLIDGGQGRQPSDLNRDADQLGTIIIAGLILAAVLLIAAWIA